MPVTIDMVEALGSETVVHAHAPTGELVLAVLQGQHGLSRGDSLKLAFNPSDLHLFDKSDRRVAGT